MSATSRAVFRKHRPLAGRRYLDSSAGPRALSGYPMVQASGWHAVYAPAGTPSPSIDRLSNAIVAALKAPEVRARLAALSLEPTGTSPEQLSAIMAADTAHWAPIVKRAGFSAQ